MRFGSVDTFFDFGDWGFRMGRPVANQGFLGALLEHGTWDAYHFFCADTAQVGLFSSKVAELVPAPELQRRIFVSPQAHLASALGEHAFDVFHQGDFTYFMPYLAALRNRAGQRPFSITGITHSLDGALMQLRFLQLVLAGLTPHDAVVCTSRAAASLVRGKLDEVTRLLDDAMHPTTPLGTCPVRTPRIPLGIDDALFDEGNRDEARRFFRVPDDVIVALSVGRISLRTKTDWSPILEELARMNAARELDRFLLIIAGGASPDGVALLEALVEVNGLGGKVLVFPNFPPEAKSKLYRAADLYISLVDNYQETFGLSVVEAMAAGLPVVASDFDGYRDAVADGESGFLVPTFGAMELPDFLAPSLGLLDANVTRLYLSQMVALDLVRLRSSLRTLLGDEALRKRLGHEGRRRAEAYRWKRVIAQYEALWTDLSAEAARATPANPSAAPLGHAALLAGDGIRAYAHFPTRQLAASDTLALTDVGRALLGDPDRATRYEDVAAVMSRDLERALLVATEATPRTVAELRALGAERFSASTGDVDFQLLWLIKHAALRVR